MSRKYWRTVILGSVATLSIVYALLVLWEVPGRQVLAVCVAAVALVLVTAVAAFIFVSGLQYLKRRISDKTVNRKQSGKEQ